MASNVKKKRKKLTKNDISNSKSNILHSINHIRANENKFVLVLVIIFICIFIGLGYFTLKIDSTSILNNFSTSLENLGVTFSSSVLTLNDEDVMDDESGLKKTPISLSLNNRAKSNYSYRLRLIEDENLKKICDCDKNIDIKNIRYSLDGRTVKTFSDESMIIETNSVDGFSGKDFNIRVWIDKSTSVDDGTHFHGRFIIESCSLEEDN